LQSQPEIYWVVADNTDAGKTIISCALIRVLNNAGVPTVGFKPYGGMALKDDFDFMIENYPKSNTLLYGSDAAELAKASPLTTIDMVEVIGPSYRLRHSRIEDVVLLRKGALLLNNREFFKLDTTANFYQRPDAQILMDKAKLPLRDAQIIKSKNPRSIDLMQPEKLVAAFEFLKSLNPKAVVCEGASAHLPAWKNGPKINHLFFISKGDVKFLPNIDLTFDLPISFFAYLGRGNRVPDFKPLIRKVRNHLNGCLTKTFYITEKAKLDGFADELVGGLLMEAGILKRSAPASGKSASAGAVSQQSEVQQRAVKRSHDK
jgi:hypothetical protein